VHDRPVAAPTILGSHVSHFAASYSLLLMQLTSAHFRTGTVGASAESKDFEHLPNHTEYVDHVSHVAVDESPL
jgi:hypothetical protein